MADRYEPSVRVPSYFPPDGLSSGIAFVAQSPGRREVDRLTPLVGASGQLLQECCAIAGINWMQSYKGNVIGFRPPGNDFGFFCSKKRELPTKNYPLTQIASGKYLRPEWFDELDRLKEELATLDPNVIVALGNEALWALTKETGITKWRGGIVESTLLPGKKVMPTWHPANVLRTYEHRLDLVVDLMKASTEADFPEIRQVRREMWIYPEVEDLWAWEKKYGQPGALLSVDIENPGGSIKCIGFAFDCYHSLCVPFWSDIRPGHSYWRELEEEIEAWDFVAHMLATYPVLGQNYYAYDNWVLARDMGLPTRHMREDTMILHHAYQPEMAKDLGYLASIYCNVPAYKTLRPRGQKATKRDE